MMPDWRRGRNRSRGDSITVAGDLVAEGLPPELGGAGVQLLDARPRGFLARITARGAANAYGFQRVFEGDPATFALLAGAPETGDGVSLAAYEANLRADVPADGSAVVRLEPLRNGVGYSFVYASSSGGGYDQATGTLGLSLAVDDAWTNTGAVIALPVAGVYELSGYFSVIAVTQNTLGGAVSPTDILGRFYDVTNGAVLTGLPSPPAAPYVFLALSAPYSGSVVVETRGSAMFTLRTQISTPISVRLEAQRRPSNPGYYSNPSIGTPWMSSRRLA